MVQKIHASFLALITLILVSCAGVSYQMAAPDAIPPDRVDWEISESSFFSELQRSYGKGLEYERAKIKYLLGHTKLSPYSFDRNGYVYDGATTAKHLRTKYRKAISKLKTAQEFIDHIATASSVSGEDYLALPGDGLAYRTQTILNYELRRLEKFMDDTHRNR